MRVFLEDDTLAGNVLAQTERSETDDVLDGRTESGIGGERAGGEALRQTMLGEDPNTVEDPLHRSRAARQPEADSRLVDDVGDDVLTVDHRRVFQLARHPGVMENPERERHVVRGERLAIRKPHAVPQVKHELAAIFRKLPRLRQRRLH